MIYSKNAIKNVIKTMQNTRFVFIPSILSMLVCLKTKIFSVILNFPRLANRNKSVSPGSYNE